MMKKNILVYRKSTSPPLKVAAARFSSKERERISNY